MWKTPIYKFRIPLSENSDKLKEIIIDVTGSAPPFKEPSPNLKEILLEIFNSEDLNLKKINTVLEFGAAKLKNIPFILKQGKTVCAIEFKELTDSSMTKRNIQKCKKYGSKFQELIFPNPFIEDTKKFDLGLLINVSPVMPVLAERLYLLDILYNKINDGKYILWVAQKEGNYKKIREAGKNFCGDGIWMGKGRYTKTFYKYHPTEELDELMALFGFKLIKRFSGPDDARLYEKTNYNLFTGLLSPRRILESINYDNDIQKSKDPDKFNIVEQTSKIKPILPNPKVFSLESLYIEKMKSIISGPTNAEVYHRVVSYAISRIFKESLRGIDIKVSTDGGIKVIDTVFTNCSEKGFFKNVKDKFDCTYPIFEFKNISTDPTNVDLDQLNGRLNTNRGRFGILVCRKIEDENSVLRRCKTYLPNNAILTLTDKEIFELLDLSRENNYNDINDFMDKKLKNLLFS